MSANAARTLIDFSQPVSLLWERRISIPFAWAGSKNYAINQHSKTGTSGFPARRAFQNRLIEAMRMSLGAQTVFAGKIWVEIFVQKPDHTGDAINFIDTICDAIKEAVGVDDKWFCINRLDWEIVKISPMIFVAIGQNCTAPMRSCYACGGIYEFNKFVGKNGKVCRVCTTAANLSFKVGP